MKPSRKPLPTSKEAPARRGPPARMPNQRPQSSSCCLKIIFFVAVFQFFAFQFYLWVSPTLSPSTPHVNVLWLDGEEMEQFPQGGNMTEWIDRYSNALGFKGSPFPPLYYVPRKDARNYTRIRAALGEKTTYVSSKDPLNDPYTVNYTLQQLAKRRVNTSDLYAWVTDKQDGTHRKVSLQPHIPPWLQVLDNYGDDAVVIGKERCAAYREAVPLSQRLVTPTGLFSTGTNILHDLLVENCVLREEEEKPPTSRTSSRQGRRRRGQNTFEKQHNVFIWQPPWGKHNPATARMHHLVPRLAYRNQSAVLPIVTIRHPFTWLFAVCQHPYALQWDHNLQFCDRSLFLNNPVSAEFGAKQVTQAYDSLIHLWRQWYWEYFAEARDFPFLMIRLEDLVYRPKKVVADVCECAGGILQDDDKFWYQTASANMGRGHGHHRSDLVTAFIKYGKPLEIFPRYFFSDKDWEVIDRVLKDKSNGRLLLDAFHYQI